MPPNRRNDPVHMSWNYRQQQTRGFAAFWEALLRMRQVQDLVLEAALYRSLGMIWSFCANLGSSNRAHRAS